MSHRLSALVASAALAGAASLGALPAHAGGVAWGVSIGVPGFSVFAGQPSFGWAPYPVVRPFAPAFVPAPVFAPPVVYRPVVRPWIRPVPVFRPRPVIVYRGR